LSDLSIWQQNDYAPTTKITLFREFNSLTSFENTRKQH
jgi:hypothetical protein